MRWVALVLALAACGEDPSLRVELEYERPPIDHVVVSVYESPTITCEMVEYADLDDTQLSALLVAEQSMDSEGNTDGALEGLSRTDHKLIVARGYALTGELLEAGCAPHDLIVENDKVHVKLHVLASVSAQQMIPMIPSPDDPLKIGVLVTDRDGLPLEDRPVSWRMVGPSGSDETQSTNIISTGDGTWQPELPECTGVKGTAQIFPVTPNLVGGFAVSIRAAWATSAQTLFSGITNTDFQLANLTIPDETKHPCAVSVKRVNGATQKRLVCVDGGFVREYPVTLANGVASLGTPVSVAMGRPPIGLFALPNEADASMSDVYALDKDGKVTGLFGATGAMTTLNCPDCADQIADAMVAPACGQRDVAKMLMVIRETGQPDRLVVMPAKGGIAGEIEVSADAGITIQLNNAGCVTAIGPSGYEPRQLTVLDLIPPLGSPLGSLTRGFYNCAPMCKRVVLPVAETAVGFTKTSPPYLIGAASDATGVVLATWGLVPDPDDATTDRLVERAARVPAGGPPGHLAIGTYDEDDGSDMIWDVFGRARAGSNFEVAYASAAGVRLEALSALVGFSVIDLFSTDVTQDQHDDIIIIGRTVVGNQGGVLVVPTHAIAPSKSIPVETCGN